MATKTFNSPIGFVLSWTERYGNNPNSMNTETGRAIQRVTNSRSWTSIPDWRAKIARGQDATTPFSGVLYFLEHVAKAKLDWSQPDGGSTFVSHYEGDNSHLNDGSLFCDSANFDTSSASNQALENFWKKLRKTQVTMSGQVFLGEIREAIRMIKSPAASLFDSHKGYLSKAQSLRRKLGSGKTGKAALADLWLEYKFGWKPFLADIEDGVKAYEDVFKVRDQTKIRAVGSSEVASWPTYGQLQTVGHNGAYHRTYVRDRKETTVIYRAGLKDDRSTTTTFEQRALKRFGLTVEEFIPTAWELTPWSFLIDYFTNIGDILEATATSTAAVAWVNKTQVKVGTREFTFKLDPAAYYAAYGAQSSRCFVSGDPGSARSVVKWVDRSVLSSVPYPSFSVSVPGSPTKWANMLALLYSQERQERKFFKR